jgi:hypothetical protein
MKRPSHRQAANLCRFDKAMPQNLELKCQSGSTQPIEKRQLLVAQKMLSVEITLSKPNSVGISASNFSVMESLI